MVWDVVFHRDAQGNVPADDFLDDCPANVRARLMAVLDAVAEAPPRIAEIVGRRSPKM